jgi:uncharacterized protein YqcC (DUF446 family)
MLAKPPILSGFEHLSAPYIFHHLKLKQFLSVLIPRGLEMLAVMQATPQELPVLPKSGSSINGAANIEFLIGQVSDLVDDVLRHGYLRY